jgi:HK97 family phage major capsid protein
MSKVHPHAHKLQAGAELFGTIRSAEDATRVLADMLCTGYKKENQGEHRTDLNKALERKAILFARANEVMHTGNTGYGKELIPAEVLMQDFLDMVPEVSPIMAAFQSGNHGRDLDPIAKLPVIGETGLHSLGSEWTTGAGAIAQGIKRLPTANVTLTQQTYYDSVDVSDRQVRYSVLDIVAMIQSKLAMGAARTQEALVINGDTTNTATGNINSDDADPADTSYYLGADGLRKKGLSAAANYADLGTFDFDDLITMLGKVGDYSANPSDLRWIFNPRTFVKAQGIAEFKEEYKNGRASTIALGNRALTDILGAPLFSSREFGLTEADGKISATPANNTKGGILLIHKNAVQFGFGSGYELEVYRIPGKGWQILGQYDMGLAIASGIAGITDPTVVLGYNVTV